MCLCGCAQADDDGSGRDDGDGRKGRGTERARPRDASCSSHRDQALQNAAGRSGSVSGSGITALHGPILTGTGPCAVQSMRNDAVTVGSRAPFGITHSWETLGR